MFETPCAKSCQGKAFLERFATDFVVCSERDADARRFHKELTNRLSDFDLEVEPGKAAMLRFGREVQRDCHQDGLPCPKVFGFLGFKDFVTRSRSGSFMVGRPTERKRFRNKLKALNGRLRPLRVAGGNPMMEFVRQHPEGHIQYYGASGNTRRVTSYYFSSRLLFVWLNRRSQNRSLIWGRFCEAIVSCLPRGRILNNVYPVPLWRTETWSRMV